MSIVCSTPDRPVRLGPASSVAGIGRQLCRKEGARRDWQAVLALAVGLASAALSAPAPAEPLAVEVSNASQPVLCAEKDNVTLNLASPAVRGFRITALHPSYIGTLKRDSHEADWSACTAPGDPRAGPPRPPKRKTLYEDIEMWVVGLTFQDFWRASSAVVRVGEHRETDIHLIQVWVIRPMGGEEVLVFYPQDGYWRLRPKAPADRAPTAFGSSVLIGPIDVEARPIVKINEVVFDPQGRSFRLSFARGGAASVRLGDLNETQHVLDVAFDQPIVGTPFAALRSMYVTEFNNDVARVAVREPGASGWREAGIMAFTHARASELWAGRVAPSRHNTSSPDLLFSQFSARGDGASAPK